MAADAGVVVGWRVDLVLQMCLEHRCAALTLRCDALNMVFSVPSTGEPGSQPSLL
jgi:hypothetical protein